MVLFHSVSYCISTMANFGKSLYLHDMILKAETVKNSHFYLIRLLHEKSGRLNKIGYFVAGEEGNYNNCQPFFYKFKLK